MRYEKYLGVIAVAAASTLSAQGNVDCSEDNKEGMYVRTVLVTFDRGTEFWQAGMAPQFGGLKAISATSIEDFPRNLPTVSERKPPHTS
jgi:hypothetical protein